MIKQFSSIEEQVAILGQRGVATDGQTPAILLIHNGIDARFDIAVAVVRCGRTFSIKDVYLTSS